MKKFTSSRRFPALAGKLVMAVMLLQMFSTSQLVAQTATAPLAGAGTSESPYQIATLDNLYWLSQNAAQWSKSYIQTADINASSTSGWDSNKGWLPIGNMDNPFIGSYDGDGKTISGLTISRGSIDNIGLFGWASNATIANLGVSAVNIAGAYNVGGLVGYNDGSSIVINCFATGSVSGNSKVGGVVGNNATAAAAISYSFADVSVSGAYNIGGLAGVNAGTVSSSYSTGSVSGTDYVGGLVGENDHVISKCYATGFVSGGSSSGGLVGIVYAGGYSSSKSCWDTQTTGKANSATGGTGKTTLEMKIQTTFTGIDSDSWDFTTIWSMNSGINSGYPYLTNNPPHLEAPLTQATNITFSTIGTTQMTIGWTIGNGSGRAVFVKQTDTGTTTPANNTTYTANTVFGSGTLISTGWYCVYNGTGTSVTVTGLTPVTKYITQVFEYNGEATAEIYNTTTASNNPKSQYTGFPGAGTADDPYQITTAADLALVATNVNAGTTYSGKYFKLMNDISLSDYTNWTPIGKDPSYVFRGSFDGNNKVISHLTITGMSDYRGLFGYVNSDATIKNLSIENCSISAGSYAGGLAGFVYLDLASSSVTISNCHTSGTISSQNMTGGLIGGIRNTESVTGGEVYNIFIRNCSSSATVSATAYSCYVGGLIGSSEGATSTDKTKFPRISSSFSSGTVTSEAESSCIGGLIGNSNSFISNCYSTANVTATNANSYVGGLIGVYFNSVISNSYSAGIVTGTGTWFKGFVSNGVENPTGCYWDTQVSTKGTSSGGLEVVGKTTADMKSPSTFTAGGWDFIGETFNGANDYWGINSTDNSGYPFLAWQGYNSMPTTQASSIVFSNVQSTQMTIGWTNGTGAKRAVFVKEETGAITNPSDKSTFTANSDWASKGSELSSSGYYCVYNNTSNTVTITGLSVATQYTVQVFEYNGDPVAEIYNTTTASNNPKTQYTGFTGAGTADDPYQISTAAELAKLATIVNSGTTYSGKYLKLMNDISLSAYTDWTPIGSNADYVFRGSFDGNTKIITNLTITGTSDYRGLFGFVYSDATIKNLTISSCSISGRWYAGGLAGFVYLDVASSSVTILNCHTSGTISSTNMTGGLIGAVRNNASTTGGDVYSIFVSNCSSSATVSATESSCYVGGLIGSSEGPSPATNAPRISRCFSSGTATSNAASSSVGGLIGYSNSSISNCYSTAHVTATDANSYAGGLIGMYYNSVISNSYSAGIVTGTRYWVKGFISNGAENPTGCYWDTQVSTQATSGGGAGVVGKTTVEMKSPYIFIAGGWDFIGETTNGANDYWGINSTDNNGYPFLAWQGYNSVPTTQASEIVFSTVQSTQMTIGWTNGTGAKRALFVKEGTGAITNPSDNSAYIASASWASKGTQLGTSGYYCVYNNTSNTGVTITGLSVATQYSVQIFEYNGSDGAETYNTNTGGNNPKSQYTGFTGVGTADDPYQITTAAELATLASSVNAGNTYSGKYLKLMDNISLYAYSDWTPIGTDDSNSFRGSFDGNNKAITNLTITGSSDYRGLFGYVKNGATIKNLTISNCSISGRWYAGGLAGFVYLDVASSSITISNCHTSGTISSTNMTGGLIGGVRNDASATGGDVYSIFVSNCSCSATVSATESSCYVGGLIGSSGGPSPATNAPRISRCFSSGTVTSNAASSSVGGLIGYSNSFISNCYSTAQVTATDANSYAGGLTGMYYNSVISNSYSAGLISGTGYWYKGFISNGAENPTGCYWDTQVSTQATSGGGAGVVGKTTAQMKTLSTFTASSWDFATPIWYISSSNNDGYPYLAWQTFSKTWTGTTDTDWNTASNWSPASVPTTSDLLTIPNTTNKPVFTGDLTIASGGSVTIAPGASLTVTGTLTNNNTSGGVILQSDVTGTGSLIVNAVAGSGTTIAQSYLTTGRWHIVSSPVAQTITEFLVGNSNIPTGTGGIRGMMDYNPTTNGWKSFFYQFHKWQYWWWHRI